jgi:periplasmic protein TonB
VTILTASGNLPHLLDGPEERGQLATASSPGIHFAGAFGVLHLDPLEPRTPRLPHQRLGPVAQLAASMALHVAFVLTGASLASTLRPSLEARRPEPLTDLQSQYVRLVFLVSELPRTTGGGGGGGNQRPDPVRRAQGIGSDPITLRVQRRPSPPASAATPDAPAVEAVPSIRSIVLDAKPLASGFFNQTGLPASGVLSGPSTGPGSGGGVGTGRGTGIGPGRGPGLGPGSGGGTGGGVYRPGGSVSAPRLIKEVRPKYTSDAMTRKIQGAVLLEAIVTADGCTTQIRVVRSLDAGGLDQEAVAAVAQWRFEPGRLGPAPVDVLVTIDVGFWIR